MRSRGLQEKTKLRVTAYRDPKPARDTTEPIV